MKFKKALTGLCAFIICLSFPIMAVAVGAEEENSSAASENTAIIQENTIEDNTEVPTEPVDETVESEEPTEENTELPTELTDEPVSEVIETPETEPYKDIKTENRATIYFRDLPVSCKVKIKNTKTGKTIKFDVNRDNEWSYSDVIKPGTYKIISITPRSSQYKIKEILDEEGKKIDEFSVKEISEGIQVINLYPQTKVTFGLLSFLKNNIFLDVCVVLLIALYIINAKGYRIPIVSNWVDNYRN